MSTYKKVDSIPLSKETAKAIIELSEAQAPFFKKEWHYSLFRILDYCANRKNGDLSPNENIWSDAPTDQDALERASQDCTKLNLEAMLEHVEQLKASDDPDRVKKGEFFETIADFILSQVEPMREKFVRFVDSSAPNSFNLS